jgi:hypothetical protein
MRMSLLLSRPAFRNAARMTFVALACGGLVAVSCTFNPGPAGSAPSSGSGTGLTTGGNPLGAANSSGQGSAGSTGSGTGSGGSSQIMPTLDGNNCGVNQYGLQNVPPDLLIILDKSGSMGNDPSDMMCPRGGGVCETKWADTTAAINMVVAQTDTTIRWGLKYFANDNACAVDDGAAIPIGPNNAMPIANSIAMTMPGGSTPTRLAVASGAAYLQTLTDPNPKFILLATDGEPNCAAGGGRQGAGADDSMGAIQAVMAAATAGFPVYVVGVGNVTAAQATLTALATAGGRAQATAPGYYPVANTPELVAVLKMIGGQITSCTFGLGQVPPDPSNIGVYSDPGMKKIPKDVTHVNGWDYGAGMKSIELFGAACDAVKAKTITNVQAIFGCPGQIIP